MKKKLVQIFVLVGSTFVFSQEIDFVPSSPQSFQFTREKTASEDEHTGKLNVNIPLLNLKGNKLSSTVTLGYFGAGVKVDDLPNDTGMTWMLNVGGIISRTVNGMPDENANDRLNKTYNEIIQTTASDCAADDMIRKICYQPSVTDSERDVFNVKVNNISASFYFDENFNPYFMKNDSEVKIKTINSNPALGNRSFIGFEMTDTSGVKYIFGGGLDYIEMTGSKMMPTPGGISNYANTSYFLQEIIHPNNEKIIFTYQNSDFETYVVNENDICYLFAGGNIGPDNNPVPVLPSDIRKSFQTLYVLNKKRINQITSSENNQAIKFNYDTKADSEFKTYLSSIELKENNVEKEKISFTYIFDGAQNNNKSERFFLTSAKVYKNSVFEKKYDFDYNDPLALPKRISYEQDMHGYFNNQYLNQSLIAAFYNPIDALSPAYTQPVLNSFGKRTPDFFYASKGILTEVTYPTGGKMIIDYEAPPMRDLEQVSGGVGLIFNNNVMEPDRFYGEYIIENVYQPQNVSISYTMGSDNQTGNHTQQFSWTLIDLDTGQTVLTGGRVLGYNNQVQTKTFQFYPGKRYKLIAQANANNAPISPGSYVIASVSLNYTKLSNAVDGYGIRVKSIKETDQGVVKSYKRLYYNAAENYNSQNFNLLRASPEISYVSVVDHQTAAPMITYALHSSNNTSAMFNSTLQDRYEFVTTSLGGDQFENGGFEKKFRKDDNEANQVLNIDPGPGFMVSSNSTGMWGYYGILLQNVISSTYFSSKSNRLMYSGSLLRTRNFIKNGNNLLKNRQINYVYNYQILKSQPNLIVFKMYDDNVDAYCDNGTVVPRIGQFYLGLYNHHTIDAKLRKEETVDYIDYMPLDSSLPDTDYDDYLNSNYRKLITMTDYTYGNSLHNQVTKQTVTTSDNTVTETSYAYAHEKGNQKLISANMIGIPLETLVVEKKTSSDAGKLVSKSEVIYPDQSSYPTPEAGNLLLPLSVKTYDMLSPSSFTEVKYNKYDEKGNLVQYTTKEGKTVTIIWGYNKTLPIAKIEGVDYVTVSDAYLDADIITASNQDANPALYNLTAEATEQNLISKFDLFGSHEALSRYLITTYSYDPLIGVRSITPPSGVREVYKYDNANRLERIENVEGKVLKTYQYHYKN